MTTAIILAGGESSRLRPLGDKSLQKFCGETLLHRHIAILQQAGYRRFVIVTNAANEETIRSECQTLVEASGIQYVLQPEPLGMGDAVARGLTAVNTEEPVYITQAHDILQPAFHAAMREQAEQQPEALLIAATWMDAYFPGGYLIPVNSSPVFSNTPFAVRGIIEKPGAGLEPSQWVTLVAHHIPDAGELAAALETTSAGNAGDRYERALAQLMTHRTTLGVPHPGETASLKYPWHMLDITELFLKHITAPRISPDVNIPESASIRGPVIIESGVRLFAGASILGPAYIGAGTIIGNNALVRDSITGSGCIIGYGTEVARSWLGDNVWFHTNYVGDSVIDSNVSFGSGTVTGNLRLDEGIIRVTVKGERIASGRNKLGQIIGSGTRVGINASLMPGVVIGRNAFVGPGVILGQDVPDDKRVMVRQDLVWDDNHYVARPEDRDAFRGKLPS